MSALILTNLISSRPTIHAARKELACPLYGAEFDPLNHHFLLVGGGGGSSSTGVPNKITLLDTSNRSNIREISDLELAKDEDSVTSLAIADSATEYLIAYAGINASSGAQKAGKNEHFRSFKIPLPAKVKKEEVGHNARASAIQPLARTAIFRSATGPVNDCYQRVLRLSPPIPQVEGSDEKLGTEKRRLRKRLVTIASGLAPHNEVVTLAALESPSDGNVISRIGLEKNEANDVDIVEQGADLGSCVLAYCTDRSLYLQPLGESNTEPVECHTTTGKMRSIRVLNARYLLVLQNRPGRTGVDLIVLRMSKDYAQTQQVLVKGLKNMKSSVGMDAVPLSTSPDGSQQFIVAVAGQDSSVQILVLDWLPMRGMTAFRVYADLVDVHNGPITRIVFSNFIPPKLPITSSTPPQYLRLATVGVDKTVVVQTLSLEPSPPSGSGDTQPRYVLMQPSQTTFTVYSFFMAFVALIIAIFLTVAFLELRGATPPIGMSKFLPRSVQSKYAVPWSPAHHAPGPVVPASMPTLESTARSVEIPTAVESAIDQIKLADASTAIESLKSMETELPSLSEIQDKLAGLAERESEGGSPLQAVIIRDLEHNGLAVSTGSAHDLDVETEGPLKSWEHLTDAEKKTWKQKLKKAGQWTEKQGESVLKGVFFGQLAGMIGGLVG